MRRFALSDIHGCALTFEAVLAHIAFSREDELYLLGDFIDRGPDSKGVIDKIWKLQQDGYSLFCLRGNHEQILLDARHDSDNRSLWLAHGGQETLASFGVTQLEDIPSPYFEWMDQLPYYFEVAEYILVHAGFRFDMPDPFLEKYAMMWQRNWYSRINRHWLGKRLIIHGHTPTPMRDIKKQLTILDKLQVLNIDNGCVYDRPGLGHLVVLNLGTRELFFQGRVG